MDIKVGLIFALVMAGAIAQGQIPREQFRDVSKGKQMDLLEEGSTLRLNQEGSVQQGNPPSDVFISFLGGVVRPSSLFVDSGNGNTKTYNFSNMLPLASIQVADLPWRSRLGKWGWAASLGYSYSQWQDNTQTALHIFPLTLSAQWRGQFQNTQKFIPYIMAGPQLWTYFQRGIDQYNSSQSALFGAATAGLAFNLNHLHLVTSRNDTELVLQYQRTVGPTGNSANFNGDTIQLGGTIAL